MEKEAIYNLTVRVLCDIIPPGLSPNIAYIFAQTGFNQKSVLDTAPLLWKEKHIPIGIRKNQESESYPGFDSWCDELCSRGIEKENIIGISSCPEVNTLSEARDLVSFARTRNFKSVCIIAPPFHQLRAFMTMVSVALKEFPGLRIYNRTANPLDWDETGVHSQGIVKGRRFQFLHSEWQRIERYSDKGDIAPIEKILKYLEWRDSGQKDYHK